MALLHQNGLLYGIVESTVCSAVRHLRAVPVGVGGIFEGAQVAFCPIGERPVHVVLPKSVFEDGAVERGTVSPAVYGAILDHPLLEAHESPVKRQSVCHQGSPSLFALS